MDSGIIPSTSQMLETGVPNLDPLLGGGLPEGDLLLVVGAGGSGKTTLAAQIAFHTALRGHNVLFSTTLSETPPRLLRHLDTYSFFSARDVGKRLFFLDIYPLVRLGLEKVTDALIAAAQEHKAALLVVDGLMTLHDLSSAPGTDTRNFMYDLAAALQPLNCTTIVTSSRSEHSKQHSAEFSVADGLLELGLETRGTRTVRTIEPRKMRGAAPPLGKHTLRIDRDGAAVFPRLEAQAVNVDVGLSAERTPFGLPELDRMMMGGLPAGSVTALTGAPGAGKTLLGLQYVMEGVRRGEKVMIAGFRETPRQLIDKARSFEMDLSKAVADEQVLLFQRPAVDLVIDEVTDALLGEMERWRPVRLVIDSYADLALNLARERRRSYMVALSAVLRSREVTTLVTVETSQIPKPQFDITDSPLTLLAQNLLLLRSVEFQGDLYRILSILKMRDSAFDPTIRECSISATGLTVLPAAESAQDVLSGITQLASASRAKRRSSEALDR